MHDFVDLVISQVCAGCAAPGARLCAGCGRILDAASPVLSMPRPAPHTMPWTWSAAPYAGVLRSVIVAWKDADRVDLTAELAPLLARSIAKALTESPSAVSAIRRGRPVALVPMPSRASSVRARGRRPVEELLADIRRRGGSMPDLTMVPALRVSSTVRDQAGLDQRDRAANLRRAMHVDPSLRSGLYDAVCVLVDDVVTTGSTLSEAARALEFSSDGPVLAATVAATARQGWS